MTSPRHEVRRTSIRVAASATAVVAIAYCLIAIGVVTFVTASLTAQVDTRLTRTLEQISLTPPRVGQPHPGTIGERPLGPEWVAWLIAPDGTATTDQEDLVLPTNYYGVTEPTTIVIDGLEIRIAGAAAGSTRLIVGEALDPVNDARMTIVAGVLLIAPILLAVVFAGAVVVGRRVAAPIEAARQRQLDFTADASHELRTPLAVIEANASLALAQKRDAAWYEGAFSKVDAESKRMRRLLDDLLWLARFDATRQPPEMEPVDLGVLARQTADRFAPVAEAKRVTLLVDAAEGSTVVAPAEWLDRLLGVLIDNACKYSPAGGLVTVRVDAQGSRVRLAVEDNGPGIPEAERTRIFNRFHRATDGASGAGLGLAIGDAIVRVTGGRWEVDQGAHGGARLAVRWARSSVAS